MKVLLVEDEEMTRIAVSEYLAILFKDEVGAVEHGKQALEWIAVKGEPDVILLDLNMPVMDGREFMRQYKGTAPIIVLSAWAGTQELPFQPFAVLQKPMKMKEMRHIMISAQEKK